MGAKIILANNGEEAIDMLKANPEIELVIMDVQMPVMDGYQATQIIREELNKEIPIIAATASAYQEDIERAHEAGMNDFIAKPFKHQELFEVMSKWIKAPMI